MKKILFVSVGGSHQPIVTAIQSLKPDQVVFFCSEESTSQVIGEGKPCEKRENKIVERLPNIPTQLKMGNQFRSKRDVIVVKDPDDLGECYDLLCKKIKQLRQLSKNCELLVDYTGGTKTMSTALAMAGIDENAHLYVTSSTRKNIIKVEYGEITGRASVSSIIAIRKIKQTIQAFVQQYNYAAAAEELRLLLRTLELLPDFKKELKKWEEWSSAFEHWDRFQHREAFQLLQPYMGTSPKIREYALFLKRVINSRSCIDEEFSSADSIPGNGYELIEDLLLNVERCVTQQRYDDAVSRIYRAIELLAQMRLFYTYGIKTGDVDLEKIPQKLRIQFSEYESSNRKIQLALEKSYQLLSDLNDPLGNYYLQHAERLKNALEIRNHSFLAHGFTPVSKQRYETTGKVLFDFIQSGLSESLESESEILQQFPQSFEFDTN